MDGRRVAGRARSWSGVPNAGFEGLVDAVLAPGLSQHFQLSVGGVAPLAAVVGPDGAHLLQVEGQATLPADGLQHGVVGVPQRDDLHRIVGLLGCHEGGVHGTVYRVVLDQGVAQDIYSQVL